MLQWTFLGLSKTIQAEILSSEAAVYIAKLAKPRG